MDLIQLQSFLDNTAFALLLGAMLIYWVGLAFGQIPYIKVIGTSTVAIANLSMAGLLICRWIEGGYFPLSNLYESLFFLAWGITLIHLVVEATTGSRLVGAVTSPVAMGITAFAALSLPGEMQNSAPLVPALKSNWLMMHVSVMMLSYATLMVGCLLAIAFLFITRGQTVELKGSSVGTGSFRNMTKETTGNGVRVISNTMLEQREGSGGLANAVAIKVDTPTLTPKTLSLAETLDNLSYRVIGLGFPLLTIGIIAGGVWANEAWGSYWSWDPKETWSFIAWLIFAAYLHARITKGWQGKKPALLATLGFVFVWICYLGVNFLGQGLHSYGWFL
ncbi:MAG: c-type cytochrome biogenesis protein CcsB [Synechococcaceae cyanobacterium RL_1_2]|nr:c-type cytochrome biogenesis protein CcsB [Synechococcaceae cyanobacterium RL_1_2]